MPPPLKSKLLSREFIDLVKDSCAQSGLLLELFEELTFVRGKMAPCPLHDDRTPSVSVTAAQGLWKCHSCGKGGTAIDLLTLAKQMNFRDAVLTLAERLRIPAPEDTTADAVRRRAAAQREVHKREKDTPAEEPLSWADQIAAYQGFLDAIRQVDGSAEANGQQWLADKRNIPVSIQDRCGRFLLVTAQTSRKVHDLLRADPQRDLYQAAGILSSTSLCLNWWDDTLLLCATDPDLDQVVHLRGRQLGKNAYPRYLAPHAKGCVIDGVRRIPRQVVFGLPQALEASRSKRPLLVVEGAIKAMGAVRHGYHAIAIGSRPGFEDAAAVDAQIQAQMMAAIMRHLRGVEIIVVPDYEQNWDERTPDDQALQRAEHAKKIDPKPAEWECPPKRQVGLQYAWELARWLAAHGIKASAQEIPDLIGPGKIGLIGDRWIKDWDEIA